MFFACSRTPPGGACPSSRNSTRSHAFTRFPVARIGARRSVPRPRLDRATFFLCAACGCRSTDARRAVSGSGKAQGRGARDARCGVRPAGCPLAFARGPYRRCDGRFFRGTRRPAAECRAAVGRRRRGASPSVPLRCRRARGSAAFTAFVVRVRSATGARDGGSRLGTARAALRARCSTSRRRWRDGATRWC